jgi:hypothetical protein
MCYYLTYVNRQQSTAGLFSANERKPKPNDEIISAFVFTCPFRKMAIPFYDVLTVSACERLFATQKKSDKTLQSFPERSTR